MKAPPVKVAAKFLPLVKAYQAEVNGFLRERINRLFLEVEPVMIDFASKAETDNAQTQFFDCISHIQSLSDQVSQAYFDRLEVGFAEFVNGESIHYPKPIIETDDIEKIGIVENDDLEIHIAIQSMFTRSRNRNHQSLYQLAQRLAVIRQGRKLFDRDVPACPEHITTTFQSLAFKFELEQKLLLILYVLFEKNVLDDIDKLYTGINTLLADAGIYPHLAPVISISKPQAQVTDEQKEVADPSPSQPVKVESGQRCRTQPLTNKDFSIGEEVFSSILFLLTERRRSDPRFKDHPEYRPDGNLEQLRSKPDLVAAINQLDMPIQLDMGIHESGVADELDARERAATAIEYLQQRIASERENIYSQLDTNTIPTADLDTIELVGMLFEHILDDPDLASLTKTLICHLHTPYLKVAIIDPDFLTNSEHITRKLLNLVVNAGRRWVDENNVDAGVYHTMRDMIQTIMRDFKDDISLFNKVYEDFLDHLRVLEHKTKVLEERTKEATRGKDRLEYSRMHAEEVMQQHCAGVRFHPVLWQFLSVVWKNYMTLLLLRDQQIEKHKEWRTVLMVINSVIKINNCYADPQGADWLRHAWPQLKKNIEAGLEFLGNTNPSEYIAFKQTIHALQSAKQTASSETVVVQPAVSTNAGARKKPGKPVRSEKMPQLLLKVQDTDIGTWFEFNEPDGKTQRVKLSWYSPVTSNHMFIDRFGYKAFVLPTDALINRLDNGTARIIEPNRFPFVDQALKKIYSLLRVE